MGPLLEFYINFQHPVCELERQLKPLKSSSQELGVFAGPSCATQPCPREPGDSACPNPALGWGVATKEKLATAQL